MPAEITLREFDFERDYAAAADLWRTSGPGVNFGRSDTPEELQKKLARDPDMFLVAETDGRLIGTVIGGFDGRRGMIYHLAVHPQSRRLGVGGLLLTEVERRLREKGCIKCYLMTTPENDEARAFYAQFGWNRMDVAILGKTFD